MPFSAFPEMDIVVKLVPCRPRTGIKSSIRRPLCWSTWASKNTKLLSLVPLPGHDIYEDDDWSVGNATQIPKDLFNLGRSAWCIVALASSSIGGVFLPCWRGRLIDQNWSPGEQKLWLICSEVVLIFAEMGPGDGVYVFDLNSQDSLRSLENTLKWQQDSPTHYTAYHHHRVLGYSQQRIQDWYNRSGNPEYANDRAKHERYAMHGNHTHKGMLKDIDGFIVHGGKWHRFFKGACPGSQTNIQTVLIQISKST
jgi:hypothetical protein